MTEFEDHLWNELVREHGDVLAKTSWGSTRHGRRRPRLLAGAGLGLAGTGTALALVLGAGGTSPAFAVTRNHDGTVTISVRGSRGIAAANARLAQLGIPARVAVQVPMGCGGQSIAGKGAPAPTPRAASAQWTIDPRQVPAGRVQVLAPGPGNPPSGRWSRRDNAGQRPLPVGRFCDCAGRGAHRWTWSRSVHTDTGIHALLHWRVCRLHPMGGQGAPMHGRGQTSLNR